MHQDPRQRLAQGWTGNRLRHRALRAPKERKGKGKRGKKRGEEKKKKKGEKTRQVQAGPRGGILTLSGFDSTSFCHLS